MSKLIIEDQRGRKTSISLARETVTVGREEGVTIRLNERNVSRRHLELRREAGVLFAVDLSRYGSLLNGSRFSGRVRLYNGDLLEVGDYKLAIELDEARPEPRPEVPPAWVDYGVARVHVLERGVVRKSWRVRGAVELGSSDEAAISLAGDRILPVHCRIRPDEQHWHIEVCDPATTLRVNNVVLQRRRLVAGDVIKLGKHVLHWLPETTLGVSVDPADIGVSEGIPGWRRWEAVGLLANSGELAPAIHKRKAD